MHLTKYSAWKRRKNGVQTCFMCEYAQKQVQCLEETKKRRTSSFTCEYTQMQVKRLEEAKNGVQAYFARGYVPIIKVTRNNVD